MHSLHYVLKVNIDNFFHLGEIYLCIACDKKTNRKKTIFSNCYSKSEKNTDTQNYIEEKKVNSRNQNEDDEEMSQ